MIGGGTCAELALPPPPQPVTRNARQTSAATLFQSNVNPASLPRSRFFKDRTSTSKNSGRTAATGSIRGRPGKFRGAPDAAGELPLVVTDTVKFTVAPLVTVTLGALQFVPSGIPEHANASVPLKPRPGVACRLNVAIWPALT